LQFLPLRDFDVVTSALNFDTPDLHVTGGCDLYTTKAAGSDKKLYKNIDRSLESQHEAMLKFGASLSPPQRSSLNLSRSSPFGPLSDVSSRKTFAYLIATLNASHPDYDFSHVLRPADFKRERPLRRAMTNLDATLRSARPNAQPTVDFPVSALLLPPAVYGTESPPWGPHMWALLDKEMTLKDCAVFSYAPALNPFEEEAAAIWSLHYFFFNKERKRVSYLYVRGVPVVSHTNGADGDATMMATSFGSEGAHKRARFWLGDRAGERVTTSTMSEDDEEDEFSADDGLIWNRDRDGTLELDEFAGSYDDDGGYDYGYEEDDDEDVDEARTIRHGSRRDTSEEDVAGRMEIE
ncbi:Maf1 regulator-domain-containing protein, partial [Coniella lustricola]